MKVEELEYIPKKVFEAKIQSTMAYSDGILVGVSGESLNPLQRIYIMNGNTAAFPIYNSELAHWAPGKKLKITVEVVE